MSLLARRAGSVHVKASSNWLVLLYIAVVVTATFALAISEAIQALGS